MINSKDMPCFLASKNRRILMNQTAIILSILAMISCTSRQASENANQNIPKMQASFDSLTAQYFADGLGLYTDPYQYFGNLTDEMHRAIRLVVDVGLHARGWTREQAIRYSLENEPYGDETIVSEIEWYMAFPGQALGYKIGY